jgi:hypothetical protein
MVGLTLAAQGCQADPGPKNPSRNDSTMETAIIFQPQKYLLPKPITHIFSVPMENTLGTTDLANAVSLIGLEADNVQIQHRLKDFVEDVGGGKLSFLPAPFGENIAYSQSRRFILIDLKTNTARQHLVCKNLEETIQRAAMIDAKQQLFLFEILAFNDDPADTSGPERILRILNFGPQGGAAGSDHKIAKNDKWTVHDGTIITYGPEKVQAFTQNFAPTNHPFVRLYEQEMTHFSTPLNIRELHLHPYLPFAIAIGTGCKDPGSAYAVWLAVWRPDQAPQLVPMIKDSDTTVYAGFQFSPDGSRLIMAEQTPKATEFMAAPINPDTPFFLEKPAPLGTVKQIFSTAWIQNPLSFVVLGDQFILRWKLSESR